MGARSVALCCRTSKSIDRSSATLTVDIASTVTAGLGE